MLASIIKGVADVGWGHLKENARVDKENDAKRKQWESNVELTQEMIGALAYRTSQEQADINRDKVNAILDTNKAVRQKEGEAAVQAAHLGVAGKRPEKLLRTAVAREGGDLVTKAELTAEIELRNSTNRYTDAAQAMIDSLNASRPTYGQGTSFLESFLTLGSSGASAYLESSAKERAQFGKDLRGIFSSGADTAYENQVLEGSTRNVPEWFGK